VLLRVLIKGEQRATWRREGHSVVKSSTNIMQTNVINVIIQAANNQNGSESIVHQSLKLKNVFVRKHISFLIQ